MKKILVLLLLAVATINANAALFINNNTTCDAVLVLRSHDVNNAGVCSYYSNRFTLAAGASVAYNNVTSVNYPAGPGWFLNGVGAATMVAAGSGWDAVTVYYSSIFFDIGASGTCAPSMSYSGSAAGCSFTNASWTPLGGGNVLLELN